jgi:hypothetical protein
MTQPYYHLELPVQQLLNPKFIANNHGQDYYTQIYKFADPEKYPVKKLPGHTYFGNEMIFCDIRDILSQEFYEFLKSADLLADQKELASLYTFYHKPQGRPGPIHCDWTIGKGENEKPRWALNWTTCTNNNQKMTWYETLDPNYDIVKQTPRADNYAAIVPEITADKVRKIAETSITGPTLVRTDTFHNAENCGIETRWCYSFRGKMADSWEAAVEWFRPWIRD